jgi:hypothetical protein
LLAFWQRAAHTYRLIHKPPPNVYVG